MPFNVEYTNRIHFSTPPNSPPDAEGEEYTLSVSTELPVWLTLPEGLEFFEHDVVLEDTVERVTVYQDCVRYNYGDYFARDQTLRYKVIRLAELQEQIKGQPETDRKYIEKLRSVVRCTRPVRIRNREWFEMHQLRRHCEVLMEACNRIMEAERSTYYVFAWNYPYRISFLSIGIFWVSLYRGNVRVEAFPFMGNAGLLALNSPYPAVPDDFAKVISAIGNGDAYPDWWLYYCKAATHHGQQNHREAVLEVIIALEMAVSKFVRTRWKQQGVSNNAIERAKRDVTLSVMLNIELMALADPASKPSGELIGRLNMARQLRNNIVHEGKTCVSEAEAAGCLASVKEALFLMGPHIYDGELMASIVRSEARADP
jgi:hypothetical protein